MNLLFFIIMLFVSALVLTVEFRDLIKCKDWLSLALGIGFILTGLTITLLIQLSVQLPSFGGLLVAIVERLFPFIPVFFGG